MIDSDYRGDHRGPLQSRPEAQTISSGERIAQLIITPVLTRPTRRQTGSPRPLRGTGGFWLHGKMGTA